ncbi:MAG: two-component regulator propeller domain-containing protein [Gemmatimonadota bacterium]
MSERLWLRPVLTGVGTALLTLAGTAPLPGQEAHPLTTPPRYAIDQWTTENGLPQNSVNAMVLGPDGHLWLGTFGGLVKFDGTSFHRVARVDSSGSHVDRVLSLAVGTDSALWIGTEDGLLHLRSDSFRAFTAADGLPRTQITALAVDHTGAVWIGTARDGVARYSDGVFRRYPDLDGMPFGRVVSIMTDATGTVWINGDHRIAMARQGAPAAIRWYTPPVRGTINLVYQGPDGVRWFSRPGGLARVDAGHVQLYSRNLGITDPSLMVGDARNGYWLGTRDDGLLLFQPRGGTALVHRYALPDGRGHFRVRSAFLDGDGNLWIGTNANGLLRVKRNVFTTYGIAQGLSHDVVTALYQDSHGTLWVGTNCGGVNEIDLRRRTVRVLNPRSPGDPHGDPCIFALGEAPSGTVWQGTYGGGVSLLKTDRPDMPRHVRGLRDSVVVALFTDRDGTLWVGTNAGGLAAVRDGRVRATYTKADGLANNSVRTIYQTRDGALWVGTREGLSRFQEGHFVNYGTAQGLGTPLVRSIFQDGQGTVWIGTYGGGLYRFRDGTFIDVTRKDGLADDVVSSILEDDRGYFWMSGNRGIFRVARNDLVAFTDGRTSRVHSVLYGAGDGLRNAETNGGFEPAALKDTSGRLWFPTLEGAAVVHPAELTVDRRPPFVSIENVVVDGVSRAPQQEIVVGPGRPNLEFRYAGVSLSAPSHVTFRYRLLGFDPRWSNVGTRRIAYYPRLQPGHYRFIVSAANRDGVWNRTGASLRLRIVPFFWNAWWFRIAVAAFVLGLVGAVVRRRQLTLQREGQAKEHFARLLIQSQERERTRLAGELHDGLGQDLLIVRNRALLALQADGANARVHEQLQHIRDVATASLESVRELAHNLTPHQLEHLGLSAALQAMIETVAETSSIRLHARIDDIDGLLPTDNEINLYRIVQEGLNNVVRHSGSDTATVRVRRVDRSIRVTIIDRGRGFAMHGDNGKRATDGFGLSGLAERARILGGTIRISSAPGHGTRIELSVPVTPQAPSPHGPPDRLRDSSGKEERT